MGILPYETIRHENFVNNMSTVLKFKYDIIIKIIDTGALYWYIIDSRNTFDGIDNRGILYGVICNECDRNRQVADGLGLGRGLS